jgi:hypothetical protein
LEDSNGILCINRVVPQPVTCRDRAGVDHMEHDRSDSDARATCSAVLKASSEQGEKSTRTRIL